MANFTFIDGKEFVARFDLRYTIDFSDWITTIPLEMCNALLEIGSPVSLEEKHEDIEVANYGALLPIGIKGLKYIIYNGVPLDHLENAIVGDNDNGTLRPFYTHNNDRIITTSFEEGIITVYYKTVKSTPWEEYGVDLPSIPDEIYTINAVADYVMTSLLRRGYKHPTQSLANNNQFLNPALSFEINAKKARNALSAFTPDERYEVSNILHEAVANYKYRYNERIGKIRML